MPLRATVRDSGTVSETVSVEVSAAVVDGVKVTSTVVDHPPVVPAFAYRFDARDRSIVISGDTSPSQNLVKLAAGADVLVHSVMYPAAIDRLVARGGLLGADRGDARWLTRAAPRDGSAACCPCGTGTSWSTRARSSATRPPRCSSR